MSSAVYFAQRRATQGGGLLDKLEQLFEVAGFEQLFGQAQLVALKLNFGERGNTTAIRPAMVRRVARRVRLAGGEPFLTDTNRSNGVRQSAPVHLRVASDHGYALDSAGAPIVIADGLRGADNVPVSIQGKHFREILVPSAIDAADSLIVLNHFTGHDRTGFCGVINHLGLCAGLPSGSSPDDAEVLQERLVEAFLGIVQGKPGKVGYLSFLIDITPDGDCWDWSDAPVVGDIGILASRDPLALDQASIDFFLQQPSIPGTRLAGCEGKDRMKQLGGGIDWDVQLRYAEQLGLGCRDYELFII